MSLLLEAWPCLGWNLGVGFLGAHGFSLCVCSHTDWTVKAQAWENPLSLRTSCPYLEHEGHDDSFDSIAVGSTDHTTKSLSSNSVCDTC